MKKCFGGTVTSPSIGHCDPQSATMALSEERCKETGILVEQQLFGFRLHVEWEKDDRGKMDKICRLIARGEDGGTRVLGRPSKKKSVRLALR